MKKTPMVDFSARVCLFPACTCWSSPSLIVAEQLFIKAETCPAGERSPYGCPDHKSGLFHQHCWAATPAGTHTFKTRPESQSCQNQSQTMVCHISYSSKM